MVDRHVAQIAPMAPFTRSVAAILLRTEERSSRYRIPFPRSVEIVGLHVSVIAHSAIGGLVVPTIADLWASLSVDEERTYTAQVADSDLLENTGFADLGALTLLAPRALSIPLKGPCDLGFDFAWKRFVAGAPIYEDALVSVSAIFRYVSDSTLAELRAALQES